MFKPKFLIFYFLLIAVIGISCASSKDDDEEGKIKILTNKEIGDMMKDSKTRYEIRTFDNPKSVSEKPFIDVYFPEPKQKEKKYPWVKIERGKTEVVDYPFNKDAFAIYEKGNKLLKAKKPKEAIPLFQKAIKTSEDCYLAHRGLAKALLATGKSKEALTHFERAIEINPYDYKSYIAKGTALIQLKNYNEARDVLITALSLKPRDKKIIKLLEANKKQMKISVYGKDFMPNSLARKEGNDIYIYYSNKDGWVGYAYGKAIWMGEPELHKSVGMEKNYTWSVNEEFQALLSLINSYYALKENGKIPRDEYLERLFTIYKDRRLDFFMYYELASRVIPQLMLLFNDTGRTYMRDYIKKYVVMPANSDSKVASGQDSW